MRGRAVFFYSTLSNVLWVGLLAWAGTSLGSSWMEVRGVFALYVWGIAIVLTVYAAFTLVRIRRRRRTVRISS